MVKNNIIKTITLIVIIFFSGVFNTKLEARGGGWGGFAAGAFTGAALSGAFSPRETVYVQPVRVQSPYKYDDYDYTRRLRDHNQRLREDQRRLMEENRQLREETRRRQENVSILQENKNLRAEHQKYERVGE